MNPRAGTTDLLVFEARPFSRLGTPPKRKLQVQYDMCQPYYTKYFQKCK